MVAQLVQRAEFSAEQRIVDRRFIAIESDVAELQRTVLDEVKSIKLSLDAEVKGFKVSLDGEVKSLKTALDNAVTRLEAADEKREEKRGGNLRQMVYAGLIPAILFLVATAVQVWAALRGGA